MTKNAYWLATAILRRNGWRVVHDFNHYPPLVGATIVYLEGPDDGPGLGPWWQGGELTPTVQAVIVQNMTRQYELRGALGLAAPRRCHYCRTGEGSQCDCV